MTPEQTAARTIPHANRIVRLRVVLLNNWGVLALAGQLLPSGASVGATSRALCPAKTRANFVNKLRTPEEESGEPLFCKTLRVGTVFLNWSQRRDLMDEVDAILRAVVLGAKTAQETGDL